jgi:hypothetical protein
MKKYNEIFIEVVAWIVVVSLLIFVIKILNQ